jgi:AraC-like DNA-binding protein
VKSTSLHPPQGSRARFRLAKDPKVRLGATVGLVPVLQDLGFDPARLLAEAGTDISLFDNRENWVSFRARNHWVAHCVERTGCRHLGLLVGQRNNLHSLGLIGLLAKYSPDVESALRSLVHYFHLHAQGALPTFHAEGAAAMFGYETYVPDVEANDQIVDAGLATLFNVLQSLCGPDWNAVEVRFAHRKPENVQPFRRFFGAPLRFDDEQNVVVFHSSWLTHRLPEDDPNLRVLLLKHVESLETKVGHNLPEQVRSLLATALLTDHASAEQIAALLAMHSRTLHRRLSTWGTSFRKLVDESRFAIASQLLADTDTDVSHVATVLNYSDPSAFARAFRRWSGTSPAAWRQGQQARSRRR